jgi:hypothetical protein
MEVIRPRLTEGSAKRCSNAPPTARGSASARSMSASAFHGGKESAWRKKRTSPRAAADGARRALGIARGGHDDLGPGAALHRDEVVERAGERRRVVARRDDDRDPRTHLATPETRRAAEAIQVGSRHEDLTPL